LLESGLGTECSEIGSDVAVGFSRDLATKTKGRNL
jgi:hypothetical protein